VETEEVLEVTMIAHHAMMTVDHAVSAVAQIEVVAVQVLVVSRVKAIGSVQDAKTRILRGETNVTAAKSQKAMMQEVRRAEEEAHLEAVAAAAVDIKVVTIIVREVSAAVAVVEIEEDLTVAALCEDQTEEVIVLRAATAKDPTRFAPIIALHLSISLCVCIRSLSIFTIF
jgi:hypothetical protein